MHFCIFGHYNLGSNTETIKFLFSMSYFSRLNQLFQHNGPQHTYVITNEDYTTIIRHNWFDRKFGVLVTLSPMSVVSFNRNLYKVGKLLKILYLTKNVSNNQVEALLIQFVVMIKWKTSWTNIHLKILIVKTLFMFSPEAFHVLGKPAVN